jgi:hypothetical protein
VSSKWKVKRPPEPRGGRRTPRPRGQQRDRPGWVWVLSIWSAYGALGAIILLPVNSHFPTASPQHQSVIDVVLSLVIAILSAAAAVSLFRLKRTALQLWIASAVAGVVAVAAHAGTNEAYRHQLTSIPRALIVGASSLVSFLVIAYLVRLRNRGVLGE